MKHLTFAVAFAATGLLTFSPGHADEPAKPTPKASVIRAIPFANYWDAKAWDKIGGIFFWHKQTDERREANRGGKPKRDVKKDRATGDKPSSYR